MGDPTSSQTDADLLSRQEIAGWEIAGEVSPGKAGDVGRGHIGDTFSIHASPPADVPVASMERLRMGLRHSICADCVKNRKNRTKPSTTGRGQVALVIHDFVKKNGEKGLYIYKFM